jgi:hypothetical protein
MADSCLFLTARSMLLLQRDRSKKSCQRRAIVVVVAAATAMARWASLIFVYDLKTNLIL